MAGTVLVTGGRQGIGRGIALAFAESGWRVVIADLVAPESGPDPGIAFVQGDIADTDGHAALLDRAEAACGPVDVLVNNAGISVSRRGDMLDVQPDSFDRLIHTNLRGPFFLTQALARRWLDRTPARPRSVITISSTNAEAASPDRAEYCLSKSALPMMTRLFALRLAEAGIGVFEIRPGIIRTAMTAVAAPRYDQAIAGGITPIRRWGEPADVAGVAVSLAEGGFHFSTGQAIHVDGGLHIARL